MMPDPKKLEDSFVDQQSVESMFMSVKGEKVGNH